MPPGRVLICCLSSCLYYSSPTAGEGGYNLRPCNCRYSRNTFNNTQNADPQSHPQSDRGRLENALPNSAGQEFGTPCNHCITAHGRSEHQRRGAAETAIGPVWDHQAAGSNPVTRTMQSVLMGSEYPVMDTLHFLFQKFIPQFVTGRSLMLRLFLFA